MPFRKFHVAARAAVRHTLLTITFALSIMAGTAQATGTLTSNADFKLLSWLGFQQAVDGAHPQGSPLNIYAWSMAWFKGKLYVGTLRNDNDGTLGSLAPLTAQIWAYTPGGSDGSSGTWALALQSPSLFIVPRESGYRWMTVCNFRGTDYLFVSTLGFLQGNVLRTTDGVTFTPLSRTGYPAQTVGFRTLSCFGETSGKQLLIVSPVGKAGDATTFDTDSSDNPVVLANEDPGGNGTWRAYSPLRMNDANNNAFFTIYAANGALYAGVNNDVTGAQVWRTTGCATKGPCLPSWTKVIDKGGGRPLDVDGNVQNVGVSDMMAYGDSLYMGVDVPTGRKPPAEMWRLRMSDNRFTVVIGEPRLNFGTGAVPTNPAYPFNLRCDVPLEDLDGVGGSNDCPPTSRRGAGFGAVGSAATGYAPGTSSYFWRLLNYAYHPTQAPFGDGRLYAGTLDLARNRPDLIRGFDIIASSDGTNWTTITNDGLGDGTSAGMRAIASSPIGLFVGSANPSNMRTASDGTNVWVGIPGTDAAPPLTTIASPPSPTEGSTVNAHAATFAWSSTDAPAPGSLPLTYAYRLDPIEPSFGAFGAATTKAYANLLNGSYTFHVIAKDAAGNTEVAGSAGAPNRRAFTISATDLAPTASFQVAPTSPNTTGSVAFSWTGSDDVTPTAGLVYDFWLSPLQSDPNTFAGTTSKTYSSLADGAYVFHVKARDGAGNVGTETTASFTVARPPGPPAAPSPASASIVSPGTVRVTWTDVAGETSYNVQRALPFGKGIYSALASNLPADTTFFDNVTGLTPGTTYAYRVQACNGAGCSAWAVTSNITLP